MKAFLALLGVFTTLDLFVNLNMGSTPSKKKKVTSNVMTKLKVVSMMSTSSKKMAPIVPPPTKPTERRENIRDIVNQLKLERRKDSVDMMRMGNDRERFRLRPRTPSIEEEVRDIDKPIWEAVSQNTLNVFQITRT